MQFLWVLLASLPLVYSDSIKVNSPSQFQVFKNSSFLVDYLIERNSENNGLVLTNTTTQLLDTDGNALVSVPKNLSSSTMVRLNMITFVQKDSVTNFTLKILGYGKYNTPFNGKSFDEIETEIPLQLDLKDNVSSPSSNSTSTPTSTTNTTSSKPTSTPTSSKTNSTSNSTSTPTSTPSQTSDAIKSVHMTMLYAVAVAMFYLI